jgi:hypothetical protein
VTAGCRAAGAVFNGAVLSRGLQNSRTCFRGSRGQFFGEENTGRRHCGPAARRRRGQFAALLGRVGVEVRNVLGVQTRAR